VSRAQPTLFEGARMSWEEALDYTEQSLKAYGLQHDHWFIGYSGGKDSSATLTVVLHLLESGRVPWPKSLTVLSADTRQELAPLEIATRQMLERLRRLENRGVRSRVVMAPLDHRFLVYMLGRGVPPPTNKFRWCTPKLKVDPMAEAVREELDRVSGSALMITGVRIGESAARDDRIALSCGKDGAECGQGWYQEVLPNSKGINGRLAVLAPLLHWRVCFVWDWLRFMAPSEEFGGWPTAMVADAYGQSEEGSADELAARTGCVGCPLVSGEDKALARVLRMKQWAYLAPLAELKPLYEELRLARHRLRKTGLNGDGTIATAKNKQRLGPLTFEARLMALGRVRGIQARINAAADRLGRPRIDILNAEEEARIRELINVGTWPNGWDGNEPTGDALLDTINPDGTVQLLLVR